jgi:hypothetical protein
LFVEKIAAIQSEIEVVGRRFINDIKGNHFGGVSSSKTTLTKEERRWHSLWLRSLEYLMILEEGPHCPQHYNISVDEHLLPSKRHKNNVEIITSANRIRNKRVQTNVAMVGETRNEFLNNTNGKLEIIQKDIGYSSDADMSDAVEAHPHSDQANLSARSVRKRHVRRRRSRAPRTRPWSFHSDWTDWDYYQTPLNCLSGDFVSSEELYNDDEKTIRNLIEFGENYESWISNDDEDLIRVSTPVSQQKVDKETKHLETSNVGVMEAHPRKTTKRSAMRFTFTLFIYVTLAIFALAITISNYSPHIQKIYPSRPPPI